MEISDRVLVCVNLMDEAARKNITIDLKGLSEKLGVPVAGTIARKKRSLDQLMKQLDDLVEGTQTASPYQVEYSPIIEQAIAMAEPAAGHFFIESHLLLCYNISLAKRVFEEKQKVRFFAFMEV